MKHRLVVLLITFSFAILGGFGQSVHAGGAPFRTLTFPSATSTSCGSWLASGGGGLASGQYPFTYLVTDGNGIVVASGQFVGQLDNGIQGIFSVQPTRNPLHFVATSTYVTSSYNVGDLYANNPCLPSNDPVSVQPTCPGDLRSQLTVNMQGYVSPGDPNALRDQPGLTRDGSRVIGWIPAGTRFTVLAGPVCVSRYAWWYITYNNHLGWTPEGTDSEYWLAPVTLPNTAITSIGQFSISPAYPTPGQPGLLLLQPDVNVTLQLDGLQNITSVQFIIPPSNWYGNGFQKTPPSRVLNGVSELRWPFLLISPMLTLTLVLKRSA